jgi:hypothetical protein
MKVVSRTMLLLLIAWGIQGCGGEPAEETPAGGETVDETPAQDTPAQDTPTLGETVVLPAGWVMNDAVSATEVEAIMGMTGFASFPEAASSASSGRPVGSFNIGSVPYSKVRFEVNVSGGSTAYDTAVGYLANAVEVPGELWTSASLGDVAMGDRSVVRIAGVRGDLFFQIEWDPATFPNLDKTGTSVALATLLINNLYGAQ